jgi:hypothetical protein
MKAPDLMGLKKEFTGKGILICFNGPFSHSVIEEIGSAVRKHLETEDARKSSVVDVFAVYIEETQNAKNYLAEKSFPEADHNSAIITIAKKDGRYEVSAGNMIEKADAAKLVERLDLINSMDKDGLKKLYKEQIRRELPPGGKGAGVGLIDIARRSSERLLYSINEVDDTYSFFSITVII